MFALNLLMTLYEARRVAVAALRIKKMNFKRQSPKRRTYKRDCKTLQAKVFIVHCDEAAGRLKNTVESISLATSGHNSLQ